MCRKLHHNRVLAAIDPVTSHFVLRDAASRKPREQPACSRFICDGKRGYIAHFKIINVDVFSGGGAARVPFIRFVPVHIPLNRPSHQTHRPVSGTEVSGQRRVALCGAGWWGGGGGGFSGGE